MRAALAAVAFLAALAVSLLAGGDDRTLAIFPVEIALAVLAGAVIARWSALALALAVPVVLPFSPSLDPGRDGEPALAYAAQAPLLTALVTIALSIGVAARRLAPRRPAWGVDDDGPARRPGSR